MALEQGLTRAIQNSEGSHYVNAPTRGQSLVRNIHGELARLLTDGNDDPLLYAYQCLDVLPSLARAVIELEKWAYAVRDATPDQIQESGAQLCH